MFASNAIRPMYSVDSTHRVRRTASLLAVLAFVGAVTLGIQHSRKARISEVCFDHLHIGMSRQEAEHILGGKPGNYATIPAGRSFCQRGIKSSVLEDGSRGTYQDWFGNHGHITWLSTRTASSGRRNSNRVGPRSGGKIPSTTFAM